jgi:hypothetical protein
MMPAPIALFAYNRPEHLRRTVDALRANPLAAESELHVFCDAARKPEHAEAVASVRRYVRTVGGFRAVRVIERERNLGLAQSIIQGVTRLCEEHGCVIVVEDDLLVAPAFLSFMNGGLARYAEEERVMQVSGYMFPVPVETPCQSLFLPLVTSWGWGCWQRSWSHFDPEARGMVRLRADTALRRKFNLNGAYDYYGMLKAQAAGKVDSWAVRWHLSVMLRDGLVLYPRETLVQNIGIDGSGTHGAGTRALQRVPTWAPAGAPRPAFPDEVREDAQACAEVQRLLRSSNPGPIRRLIRRLIA